MTPHVFLRSLLAGAVMAACAATVAACGDSGGPDRDAASAVSDSAPSEPITVEHRYGTTVVEDRPERVVSLDTQWTDVLIAMGRPPIGYALDPTVSNGTFPWRGDALAESEGIDVSNGIPYETIAALDPDLIVITFVATEESDYERLSQIAPTIPLLSTNQVDSWQDIARTAGVVLGDEARADELLGEAEQLTAELRADVPGLGGKTFAMANYVPGDAIYVVADPEDGATVFFENLGLGITPTILDRADDVSGRVELSVENVSLLDADVLVLFTNGEDPAEIPGYDELPAVRSGAVAVLDYTGVVGLNTPTPLSIPYSLELIRPALETAARGS